MTPEEMYQLIRPRKVCLCRSVSELEIIECIQKGNHTLEEISSQTRAMTGCGSCRNAVLRILNKELSKKDMRENHDFSNKYGNEPGWKSSTT
jgi:bacterioferritin-associated ferredoxin